METSLHRDLKRFYAGDDAAVEVRMGRYRIDVVRDGELIEIQHGSLAALRDKIRTLTTDYNVRVVKPIVVRKTLIKQTRAGGKVVERRMSPKRGKVLDLFDELIYFRTLFPHPRLKLEVALVEVEEWRYPGQGRRRRRHSNAFQVEDQKLVAVHETHVFSTGTDLTALLPLAMPAIFHTGHVAEGLGMHRSIAQKIVYCLREMSLLRKVGKERNAHLYELAPVPEITAPPPEPKPRRKRRKAA